MQLVARALRVFIVLAFSLALLAIDLRFARALALEPDALAVIRMLVHVAIGAGIVVALQRPSHR